MHRQWLKRKRVSPASFNLIGTAAGAFPLAGYAPQNSHKCGSDKCGQEKSGNENPALKANRARDPVPPVNCSSQLLQPQMLAILQAGQKCSKLVGLPHNENLRARIRRLP